MHLWCEHITSFSSVHKSVRKTWPLTLIQNCSWVILGGHVLGNVGMNQAGSSVLILLTDWHTVCNVCTMQKKLWHHYTISHSHVAVRRRRSLGRQKVKNKQPQHGGSLLPGSEWCQRDTHVHTRAHTCTEHFRCPSPKPRWCIWTTDTRLVCRIIKICEPKPLTC